MKQQNVFTYEELSQIIATQLGVTGAKISLEGINNLSKVLSGKEESIQLFYQDIELGCIKFQITRKEIEEMVKSYLRAFDEKLIDLKYDESFVIASYYEFYDVKNDSKESNVSPVYLAEIDYKTLSKIIIELERKNGTFLELTDLEVLHQRLIGEVNKAPFLCYYDVERTNFEKKVNCSSSEAKQELQLYLNSRGLELKNLEFSDKVRISFVKSSKKMVEKPTNHEIVTITNSTEKLNTSKNKDAIAAGTSILATIASLLVLNTDRFNRALNHITDETATYNESLGAVSIPIVSAICAASSCLFIVRYLKNTKVCQNAIDGLKKISEAIKSLKTGQKSYD